MDLLEDSVDVNREGLSSLSVSLLIIAFGSGFLLSSLSGSGGHFKLLLEFRESAYILLGILIKSQIGTKGDLIG